MYNYELDNTSEVCFILMLVSCLSFVISVPSYYRAWENSFSFEAYMSLSKGFPIVLILSSLISLWGGPSGNKLLILVWLMFWLFFIYISFFLYDEVNFILFVLFCTLAIYLLYWSYYNVYILSNLAFYGFDINSLEFLIGWNDLEGKWLDVFEMHGRSFRQTYDIGFRAFTALHALGCLKNQEFLPGILHNIFFKEGGRLIALKINTLLPKLFVETHSIGEIVRLADSIEYKPSTGFHSIPYLSDQKIIKSDSIQQFILAKQRGCNFETMSLGECEPYFKKGFAGFKDEVNRVSVNLVSKKIGSVFDCIYPVKKGSMNFEEFSSAKSASDGVQIQEVLACVHMKDKEGLTRILRPEANHQGDLSAFYKGQRIFAEFKMLDSSLDLRPDFGVKSVQISIEKAYGIFDGVFKFEKSSFYKVPVGSPKILVFDLSAVRVISVEEFKNKIGILLNNIDPDILKKCLIIDSLHQASYDRINILFIHEIEMLGKIDYKSLFAERLDEYQKKLLELWETYEYKEEMSEYIVRSRVGAVDKFSTSLINYLKGNGGKDVK